MPRLNLSYEQVLGYFRGKHPAAREVLVEVLQRDVKEMGEAPVKRKGAKPGPKPKPPADAAPLSAVAQDEALEKKQAKKKKKGKRGKKGAAGAPNGGAGEASSAPAAAAAPVAPPVEAE